VPACTVDRARGVRAERDDPPLPPLAAAHDRGPGDGVDVREPQRDDLPRSRAGLHHEPTSASSRRSRMSFLAQAIELRPGLVVAQRFDDLGVELRRLHAEERVGRDLTLLGEPRGEPALAELA
jgi:hypothetical protein